MSDRKTYDTNFKAEAVKLAQATGISQAARDLGLPDNTMRNWVRLATERPDNPFVGSGNKYISPQNAEFVRLQKEIRELKRANEILKEAMSFFAVSRKK